MPGAVVNFGDFLGAQVAPEFRGAAGQELEAWRQGL